MIEVVAGIIYKNDKILIAKRNLKKAQGGLWEFPGGKLEIGETYQEALKREIKEELNANIEVGEYYDEYIFHSSEKDFKIDFYKAKLLSDNIELLEHEDLKWVTCDEISNYKFAIADTCIANKLNSNK